MAYVKGKKPKGCILCLVRDHHPDTVDLTVYRDDLFIVSVNLYPYNSGHLLLFPTRHIEDMREFTAEEDKRMALLNRYLLDVLDQLYSPSGYNLGINMGLPAGASITHLHYHIIPRFLSELGVADLIGGKKVLVEDPRVTCDRVKESLSKHKALSRLGQRRDHEQPS